MTAKRLIQPDDLYHMVTVEAPRLAPNGETIAFVHMTRDRDSGTTQRNIWLVDADGSNLRQLTTASRQDRLPSWSPDGTHIAFISNRSGKPQLFVIATNGGEARQLTDMPNGISGTPAWSADGTQIAFLAAMHPVEMDAEERGAPLPDFPAPDPYVFDRVPVDFDDKGRIMQIYTVAAAVPNSNPQRIGRTAASFSAPGWLPDGDIISGRSSQPHSDAPWQHKQAVRVAVADGTVTPITAESDRTYDPLPAPDGKTIAFIMRPGKLPLNRVFHLAVMPTAGGEMQVLTASLDRSLELHSWAPDSATIYITARNGGYTTLHRVRTADGTVEPIDIGNCTVTGLDASAPGKVTFTAFKADGSHEVYLYDGEQARALTQFNAAWLEQVIVCEAEDVRYTAADGHELQGWLMKPTNSAPGKKYPLALNIHGGPSLMYGPASPSLWLEWQHHAASGYGVFYCNPRGSTGYGEAFLLANQGNWGTLPAGDVLAGVDAVVARADWIDAERLVLTGGSYGGYLTVWIIAHDDRFKAAVSQRGPYSLFSFHGTTDIPVFVSSNMQAEPWENIDRYIEQSPIHHSHTINTPLLILHSQNDTRVPLSEAIQLFTMLKRQGKPVQLVVFPEETHELSRSGKPHRMIERLNRIVAWWDAHCQKIPSEQKEEQ